MEGLYSGAENAIEYQNRGRATPQFSKLLLTSKEKFDDPCS
jgi:hypothetical protein